MTGQLSKSHVFLLLPFLLVLSSCYPSKKLTVMATASLVEDVAVASYRQSELEVVRQGMPAYLMLMDVFHIYLFNSTILFHQRSLVNTKILVLIFLRF